MSNVIYCLNSRLFSVLQITLFNLILPAVCFEHIVVLECLIKLRNSNRQVSFNDTVRKAVDKLRKTKNIRNYLKCMCLA